MSFNLDHPEYVDAAHDIDTGRLICCEQCGAPSRIREGVPSYLATKDDLEFECDCVDNSLEREEQEAA
jgi:hypothetical protein